MDRGDEHRPSAERPRLRSWPRIARSESSPPSSSPTSPARCPSPGNRIPSARARGSSASMTPWRRRSRPPAGPSRSSPATPSWPPSVRPRHSRTCRARTARRALDAALEEGLALRIGVNTGEVVAGVARAGSSFVSGDAVNVAARLEQAAEPGETLAGERTGWGRTRGVRVRRAVYRGGEGEAGRRSVPTRRPRALADASARVSGLARAFVERDDEVRRLCEAYHAAVKTSRAPVTRRTVPA
jgi:hypothetical protein